MLEEHRSYGVVCKVLLVDLCHKQTHCSLHSILFAFAAIVPTHKPLAAR
jgi:hypothetical protein